MSHIEPSAKDTEEQTLSTLAVKEAEKDFVDDGAHCEDTDDEE